MAHRTAAQAGSLTDAGLVRGFGALAAAELRQCVPRRAGAGLIHDLAGAVGVLVTIVASSSASSEAEVLAERRRMLALDPFLEEGDRSVAEEAFLAVGVELGIGESTGEATVHGLVLAARHLYPDVVAVSARAQSPVEALLDLIGIVSAGRQ